MFGVRKACRELAEWCHETKQENDRLKTENAKMCDERERLFRANVEKNGEILRLLEENARLKQELEAVGTAAYLYGRTDLADENAKLRELVRWMYDRMDESCAVQHCYAPAPINYDTLMQANARAYELGIEVGQ